MPARHPEIPVNMADIDHQKVNSAVENLSKVTDGIKDILTDALDDVKETNRVLREIVNSGGPTPGTGTSGISDIDIKNFKQAIRERLNASDSFTQASRSVASYASDDRELENIKEELSKNSLKKLKSYLNTIKERLGNCRKCLGEIQTDYSYVNRLALKHENCIMEKSRRDQCVFLISATAGSSLAGLAGFFMAKAVLSTFKSFPLPGDGDSLVDLSRNLSLTKQQAGTRFHMYEYILCLLFGVTIGIGCFYLAKRLGFRQQLGSGQPSCFKEPGVVMLRSAIESTSHILKKLPETKDKIRDLEQTLDKVRECTPANGDTDTFATQLDKFQQEMGVLLTLIEPRLLM